MAGFAVTGAPTLRALSLPGALARTCRGPRARLSHRVGGCGAGRAQPPAPVTCRARTSAERTKDDSSDGGGLLYVEEQQLRRKESELQTIERDVKERDGELQKTVASLRSLTDAFSRDALAKYADYLIGVLKDLRDDAQSVQSEIQTMKEVRLAFPLR